jgi:hypothetical protein
MPAFPGKTDTWKEPLAPVIRVYRLLEVFFAFCQAFGLQKEEGEDWLNGVFLHLDLQSTDKAGPIRQDSARGQLLSFQT